MEDPDEHADAILPKLQDVTSLFGAPCAIMRDLGRAVTEAAQGLPKALGISIPMRGVKIQAFDPVANAAAARAPEMRGVELKGDAYETARGVDALAIVTEWNEFRNLDLRKLRRLMRRPNLCDLRNLYDRAEVEKAGLVHVAVGRGRPAVKGGR